MARDQTDLQPFPAYQCQASGEAELVKGGDAAALPGRRQALVCPCEDLPVQLSVRDVLPFCRHALHAASPLSPGRSSGESSSRTADAECSTPLIHSHTPTRETHVLQRMPHYRCSIRWLQSCGDTPYAGQPKRGLHPYSASCLHVRGRESACSVMAETGQLCDPAQVVEAEGNTPGGGRGC